MAADLMTQVGEAKFFASLNESAGTDARWGKKAVSWDRARFEPASRSTDPAVRAELFSALDRLEAAYLAEVLTSDSESRAALTHQGGG